MRKMLAAVSRVLSGAAQKPVRRCVRPGVGRKRGRDEARSRKTRRAGWAPGHPVAPPRVRRDALGTTAFVLPPGVVLSWAREGRLLGHLRRRGDGELYKIRVEVKRGSRHGVKTCAPEVPVRLLQTEEGARGPWVSSSLHLTPPSRPTHFTSS